MSPTALPQESGQPGHRPSWGQLFWIVPAPVESAQPVGPKGEDLQKQSRCFPCREEEPWI